MSRHERSKEHIVNEVLLFAIGAAVFAVSTGGTIAAMLIPSPSSVRIVEESPDVDDEAGDVDNDGEAETEMVDELETSGQAHSAPPVLRLVVDRRVA